VSTVKFLLFEFIHQSTVKSTLLIQLQLLFFSIRSGMNISMHRIYLLLILSLAKTNFAQVILFNTEDASVVQSYDCIYYTDVAAANNETTPYCVRKNESVSLNRSFLTHTCQNSSEEWSFKSLKEKNVSPDEVLSWSSSIEVADRYAAYLITG
jgi:hypothetical protein